MAFTKMQRDEAKSSKQLAPDPSLEVGVFERLVSIDEGSVSQEGYTGLLGQTNVRTTSLGHDSALISAPEGQYLIEPPVSLIIPLLAGSTIDPHKDWFMGYLKPGDKVLFSSFCDPRRNCDIRVPNPDRPGKEFKTVGRFIPYGSAKTNLTVLCGTGRLTADMEAQVCGR